MPVMSSQVTDEPLPAQTDRELESQTGRLVEDIWSLFNCPGVLFSNLPQRNRSAYALVVLICLEILGACAMISTGVVDYEVDLKAQMETSRLLRRLEGDSNTKELASALEAVDKGAAFTKLTDRLLLVLGGPVRLLIGVFLLGVICFPVVALKGRKPDFSLLAGVAVFAAFVEVPKLLVRLLLISQLQVSRVETSAAAFAAGPDVSLAVYILLRRLDPFEVWYWFLIALGLWKTGQLSGRSSVVLACVLAVLAAVVQSAADFQELAK